MRTTIRGVGTVAAMVVAVAAVGGLALPSPAAAQDQRQVKGINCPNGQSRQGAMWYSIAHPGLGEWYLNGWGPFENAPQKKFWLGFIPGYGWPGYLQVKSAIDAYNCRTNDELTF